MSKRGQWSQMTCDELDALDVADNKRQGRRDAFRRGKPETIIRYWDENAPEYDELLIIVRNILMRMQ